MKGVPYPVAHFARTRFRNFHWVLAVLAQAIAIYGLSGYRLFLILLNWVYRASEINTDSLSSEGKGKKKIVIVPATSRVHATTKPYFTPGKKNLALHPDVLLSPPSRTALVSTPANNLAMSGAAASVGKAALAKGAKRDPELYVFRPYLPPRLPLFGY